MLASELQVFKDTENFVFEIIKLYPQLPKTHKYTIGVCLYNTSLDLLDFIIKANRHKENRVSYLEDFLDCFEKCETLLRLLKKGRLLSTKKETEFALMSVKIGKQIRGWKNASAS